MGRRLTLLLFAAVFSVADQPAAQQTPETKGITPKVKLEEVITGHLAELNGKFKLRVTEVTFAPGGYLGEHHHAGPGIRFVAAGKLTFTQGGKSTIYQTGDYFFESGNIVHTGHNKTNAPVRVIFVEILPTDWAGPSLIVPRAY
jgi:quercetin dioxygenase-like cupin family protein